MPDVIDDLRRYAEAAGEAVPPVPAVRGRRRPVRPAVAVAAAAAAILGLLALDATREDDDGVDVAADGGFELVVPERGALGTTLPDGTPVWVVRHPDRSVSVVDALSPHAPWGLRQLVGWCAATRGFEDATHGSQFDEQGRRRGGPSALPLRRYPSRVLDGRRVLVTGPAQAGLAGPGEGSGEPYCGGDGRLTMPSLDVEELSPGELEHDRPDRPVLLRDVTLVVVAGRPGTVCDGPGVHYTSPPTCDGLPAPELSGLGDTSWAIIEGSFLVRIDDRGAVRDVTSVDTYVLETSAGRSGGRGGGH